jgi:hypothetical protein
MQLEPGLAKKLLVILYFQGEKLDEMKKSGAK